MQIKRCVALSQFPPLSCLGKGTTLYFLLECTSKPNVRSGNVNEVIRAVLDFYLFIYCSKRFYTHKKHKTHMSEQKQKRQRFYALKKHLRERKSLIRLFAFLCFLYFLCFWCFLCFMCFCFVASLHFLCFLCL